MIMGIMKSFVFKLLLVGFAFAGACACGKTDRVDLEEELDPEVVEEIYDWFKEEATSDSLQEAIAALEDEYEEMEIRLVRIKFLCEVAN